MSQLRQANDNLAERNIATCIVTFEQDYMSLAYVQKTDLHWPLLLDRDRELYQSYGMGRGDWRSIYGLRSIWNYLKLIAGGSRVARPGSDFRQLGGDVLIDPDGIVRMHYVSTSPHDRPSVASILALAD